MASESDIQPEQIVEPVSNIELNSWRRGFTPQAEIWNGRMAMGALAFVFISLLAFNLILGK